MLLTVQSVCLVKLDPHLRPLTLQRLWQVCDQHSIIYELSIWHFIESGANKSAGEGYEELSRFTRDNDEHAYQDIGNQK